MPGLAALLGRGRRVPRKGFLQLSAKQGNKNFYKGNGAISAGTKTSKGSFHVHPAKVPKYVIPDLTSFKLKPYVVVDGTSS